MKKIKIIDLLNMISKGEEVPKKIKYANIIYKATYIPNGDLFQYIDITNDEEYFSYYCVPLRLNDEVKIIEEPQEHKIPEKLKWVDYNIEFTHEDFNKEFRNICNAVDEIIDYLEEIE